MSKAKHILTWKPNWSRRGGRSGRWCKRIDGVVTYFGHASSQNDPEARRQAEQRYFAFLREREASAPVEIRVAEVTVSQAIARYLQDLKARYDRSEVSAGHFERCRCDLNEFAVSVGPAKRLGCIGEMDLEDYRNYTLSLPVSPATERRIALPTATGRLKTVKMFFRWAWKMRVIENLPRNIDGISCLPNGTAHQPEPKPFTLDELKLLWQAADSRARCFLALGLNAGMYQQDISDLLNSQVDWEQGYVDRLRPKTHVRARHKLWATTLELMKKHRCPSAGPDERVFLSNIYLNQQGRVQVRGSMKPLPLVRRIIRDGKYCHTDTIKNLFDRLLKKVGIDGGRGFSSLRDMGATLIEQIDPAVTEMYLSHSEPGMKRHYAERDWARLERALLEMEKRISGIISSKELAGGATTTSGD